MANSAFSIGGVVSDTVYGSGWNGDVGIAPSKNAVYDKVEALSGTYAPLSAGKLIGSYVAADDAQTEMGVTGIPSTFTDLIVVVRGRGVGGAWAGNFPVYMQVGNGSYDTTSGNYTWGIQSLDANVNTTADETSSGAVSTGVVLGRGNTGFPQSTATADYFGVGEVRIVRYANTSNWRDMFGQVNNRLGSAQIFGAWENKAAAIDRVRLVVEASRTFKAGSGIWVYGVG
jgi:hypothetical protein